MKSVPQLDLSILQDINNVKREESNRLQKYEYLYYLYELDDEKDIEIEKLSRQF